MTQTPFLFFEKGMEMKLKKHLLALFLFFLFSAPAFADLGGLDKVNEFMENIVDVLRGVSVVAVTIAIMWAGYKFLFQHATMADCGKILGGGLLIGAASEIARWLMS